MPRASAISRMLVESTPCWPNRSVAVWRILWRSGSGGAGVVDFGIVTGRTVTGLAERTPPDWVGWRRVCLPTSQTIGNPGRADEGRDRWRRFDGLVVWGAALRGRPRRMARRRLARPRGHRARARAAHDLRGP